ncbi:MAG: hypothetical protein Q8O52_01455 [Sulfuritalea sp.]|nr:hypothetical protein [Sulfuritalea sp.]
MVITLSGYAAYLGQMYSSHPRQVVKPQPLSWIGFGFLTGAGWLIQVAQGGDEGSWCLGITALACLLIGGLSLVKFPWNFDRRSASIAAVGIALFILSIPTRTLDGWATFSAICVTLADVAFYEPTIKKALRSPYEESVTNFTFNSIKCVPALLALQTFTLATTIYLFMLTLVNGGFAIFLLYRRCQFAQTGRASR